MSSALEELIMRASVDEEFRKGLLTDPSVVEYLSDTDKATLMRALKAIEIDMPIEVDERVTKFDGATIPDDQGPWQNTPFTS